MIMPHLNDLIRFNGAEPPPDNLIPSPYLHLLAAGSDGSDGSVAGAHLRWSFRRELLGNHLPKGALSEPPSPFAVVGGFNKADDFVLLYRHVYERQPLTLDFRAVPDRVVEVGQPYWEYLLAGPHDMSCLVRLKFPDRALYQNARADHDPANNVSAFLNSYSGVIEAVVPERLGFAAELLFSGPVSQQERNGRAWVEAISVSDSRPGADRVLAYRGLGEFYFPGNIGKDRGRVKVVAENLESLRFRSQGCVPAVIHFETYESFLYNSPNWERVDQCSLSLDDELVTSRLLGPIEGGLSRWPRFRRGAAVNPPNYLARWRSRANGPQGLSDGVRAYLEASRLDPRAVQNLVDDNPDDGGGMHVSLLDLLQLTAIDFHAARMLGMGSIDVLPSANPEQSYVYAAVYETAVGAPLPFADGHRRRYHMALSLPTGIHNHRLPSVPQTLPVQYGLPVNDAGANAMLTDENGYTPFGDRRAVRLFKRGFLYYQPPGPFFQTDHLFQSADLSRPVLIGIEYRKRGEPQWRSPDLLHDPELKDARGVYETVPVVDGNDPLYVHLEDEEGVHEYALYGINLFSRSSSLGEVIVTDETRFPQRNSLLPPANAAVQYIQKESPPILTSATEQDMLADYAAGLTRLTFEWNHAHHDAFQHADTVAVYFRTEPWLKIEGRITRVTSDPQRDDLVVVQTGPVRISSQALPSKIHPRIEAADAERFIGSFLMVGGKAYQVSHVDARIPDQPSVTLIIPDEPVPADTGGGNGGVFITMHNYQHPPLERFSLSENLDREGAWSRLKQTVALIRHSHHRETETLADGTRITHHYGGLFGSAEIVHERIPDVYRIRFHRETLMDHPNPMVDWAAGSARVETQAGKTIVVRVFAIQSRNPLEILVHHPGVGEDPLVEGDGRDVNFHPGYRVYLSPEPGFEQADILPENGSRSRTTHMALRAMVIEDNAVKMRSSPTGALSLIARRIEEPQRPGRPEGPVFAGRPNSYGKSAYSFDTIVDTGNGRRPFSLIFYRAPGRALLDALWLPSTVTRIMAMAALHNDDFWRVLTQLEFSQSGGFKPVGNYPLPPPDNNRINPAFDGVTQPERLATAVEAALHSAFVPLTERPVIYAGLQEGRQTRADQPHYRDPETGKLLSARHPDYDPAPMASRFQDQGFHKVRFTDYRLDGGSYERYFYSSVEMAANGRRSPRAPISQPIHLVNTIPPEAPRIQQVKVVIADADTGPAVKITVAEYPGHARVERLALYRALDSGAALSVRTMTLLKTFPSGKPLLDDFADLPFPPFGKPLFYRVTAQRAIINERGEKELVHSKPSQKAAASVIDVVNPPMPLLSSDIGIRIDAPAGLGRVTLRWSAVAFGAVYHLFRMTRQGQWRRFYTTDAELNEFSYPPENGDFESHPETLLLQKEDELGNERFHRFRLEVVNTSGLRADQPGELVI